MARVAASSAGQPLGRCESLTVAVDERAGLGEPDSGLTMSGIEAQRILEQHHGSLHIFLIQPSIS
jgi:hypothetical protein